MRSSAEEITLKPFSAIPEWDRFVDDHEKGTIYHSSAMLRCQAKTANWQPFAYGALTGSGELCAVLAAVRVTTIPRLPSSLSSRSIFHAEPIYSETKQGWDGVMELIASHDRFMKRKVLFAESRPIFPQVESNPDPFLQNGYKRLGYFNFEVRIDQPESALFAQLDPKRRNNIRNSERKGLTVSELPPAIGTDDLYRLLQLSHSRSRVPLVDKSLFLSVNNELPSSRYRILIASYQGEPVAGGCFLSYKDRVICWFAGTKRIPGIAGMTCVFWEAMKLYSSLGFRVFDLAGAGWEGETYGPGLFKSKFGGERLNCGRYRKVFAPWKLKAMDFLYQRLRGWL